MSTKKSKEKAGERKLVMLNPGATGARTEADRKHFQMRVIGQDDAIEAAIAAARRARSPLRDPDTPIMIIYELGPSRSGKTLIAETLAELLHGNKRAHVKINGGNYKERHQVAQLIGAPPGYLGHREGDLDERKPQEASKSDTHAKLTRKNIVASRMGSQTPVSVILIDEANLMHASFDDVLMSVFDKGELDMGNNLVTDFRDCIIILTSNLGMDEVLKKAGRRIGFCQDEEPITDELIDETVKKALSERYRPEWLNRISRFVIFKKHTIENLYKIVDTELEQVYRRLERGLKRGDMFTLEVEESAKAFLLRTTLADNNNLAQLKRSIQDQLVDALDSLLEQGAIHGGDIVVVRHNDGDSALSFLLDADSRIVFDADAVEGVMDTADSQEWLASQRRVERARRTRTEVESFDIILSETGERRMINAAAETIRELREIYGIEVIRHSYARCKPWTAILTVKATAAQIEEYSKVNTDHKVAPCTTA
jgi:hypothetical protein